MKKLKLKALELGASEILTRAHLKNVLAGFADSTSPPKQCQVTCSAVSNVTDYYTWNMASGYCTQDSDCSYPVCDSGHGKIVSQVWHCVGFN